MYEKIELSEVYDSFLSKVTDYTLLTLTDEEIEEDLYRYFKSARTKFYRCKSDLYVETYKTIFDVDGSVIEKTLITPITFPLGLHPFEVEILATLMLVEHITPTLNSSEVVKQSLSDKDFKVYSQANQLRELRLLRRELKSEANKMITEYTYFGLDKEQM